MTSVLVTAPAVEPISLSEAKEHLRVDGSDEDTLISGLISAAVSHVDADGVLGRAMISQTWAYWTRSSPGVVTLPMSPFQSLTSVEYYDADNALQSATASDFETRLAGDRVTLRPKSGKVWPPAYTREDAIKITYVAGFGAAATDVPQSIRQALLLLIGHWYESRTAVSEISMKEVPLAVGSLIGCERVGWYG